VHEVPYDAVGHLRESWHREDFPTLDPAQFHAAMGEAAVARGVRVLAMEDQGQPVGFSDLDPDAGGIEIGSVYVLPEYRAQGRGTALTAAAIAAAGDAEHLWICADAEGRPRHLYARLGFVPVLETVEFLRLPAGAAARP
jgi:GNAT superfamily N-acetyltransferase